MLHIQRLEDAAVAAPTVLTIGMFDGVHRGHQLLLAEVRAHARERAAIPAVLTFYPHPKLVLGGWQPGFYLTSPDERAAALGAQGIALVITHPFDDAVRQLRARDFVTRLKQHLNLAALVVGPDFALGYQREGDVPFLRALGAELGYAVHVIDAKLVHKDAPVSSNRIRQALAAGDVALAAELLGRPYALGGEVVHGQQRGRTIGIPTANIAPFEERAVPARGVYVTWAQVDGERYPAVTNIGVRPTFEGAERVSIEAHLLDFEGDLYGKTLELEFIERLRAEQRFAGVEALVAQIKRDIEEGRRVLVGRGEAL